MRNTGEAGWSEMLDVLSEDELRQYGQMALDQMKIEARWAWLQAFLIAGGLLCLAYGVVGGVRRGADWAVIYAFAASAGLLYWPWRSRQIKRLWRGHYDAVKHELERRQSEAGT
ncbi:MAG: hypothetical protein NW217_11030 [Hyphomicrobiaceae bacterium]|nr:hypothetical protein [Hyphomicrobiaceae bacterium]